MFVVLLSRSTDYGRTFSKDDDKFDSNAVIDNFYPCPNNKMKVSSCMTMKWQWGTIDYEDRQRDVREVTDRETG